MAVNVKQVVYLDLPIALELNRPMRLSQPLHCRHGVQHGVLDRRCLPGTVQMARLREGQVAGCTKILAGLAEKVLRIPRRRGTVQTVTSIVRWTALRSLFPGQDGHSCRCS